MNCASVDIFTMNFIVDRDDENNKANLNKLKNNGHPFNIIVDFIDEATQDILKSAIKEVVDDIFRDIVMD